MTRRAPSDGTRRALRIGEVAAQLGVSDRTVGGWAAEGLLPHVRIKGVVLIRPADLDAFLAQHLEGNDIDRQRHKSTRKTA